MCSKIKFLKKTSSRYYLKIFMIQGFLRSLFCRGAVKFFISLICMINLICSGFFSDFVAQAASVSLSTSSCRLTPGNVYRAPLVTTVFYITADCQKRPIFNPDVYFSYYQDWSPVIFVEQPELDAVANHPLRFMPWGPRRTFQNGSLIKTTDDAHVFLIADGKAYPFGSEEAFKAFGYSFDQVEDVSVDGMAKFQKQTDVILTLDQIPVSTIFKYLNKPEVYVLVDESGVLKKWHIATMEELKTRGRADRIAVFPITKVFEDGANSPVFQATHVPLQFSFNLSETTSTLSGVFTLETIPLNNAVISSVKYSIGSTQIATVTSAPFTYPLNTTSYLDLPNTITALVTGDDGEVKSVTRQIIIKNVSAGGGGGGASGGSSGGGGGNSGGGGSSNSSDTTAPVVTSFSLPETANSLTVTLSSFSASDAVGVTGYLLTETAGAPSASAAGWTSSIPTYYAFASMGSRMLFAWAKDAAGNVSLSRSATVVITDTQPPVISSVASSTSVSGAIITWATDESSTSTVEYGTSLSYGSTSSSRIAGASHSIVLTGLTANTLYHFRVSSADGSNNRTVSGDRTFRTSAAPDVTPPSVSMTVPLTGATVSGTALSVQATASDDIAIASVTFKIDGAVISSDSSSPYTTTLNTGIYSNGAHTISAVALDSSNNRSTSTISVTINNVGGDATIPVVSSFTLPSTSLSRTVAVAGFTATDDVGVTGYLLSESSNQPAPTDGGWSATPQTIYGFGTDGLKTLYAWAKDATGNVSLSASASVTVDTGAPIISFSSPTNGATISGISTLIASATDAFSIASVSFRIDGSVISLDTSSPYTASLNTALYATGTHTLTAIATDEAGNAAVSTVTVTIAVIDANALNYLFAYNSDPANGATGVLNSFRRDAWEATDGALSTNMAASAPGLSGQVAEEVRFGANNGWGAIGFARRNAEWTTYPVFLNQFRTIEFDVYFASDSTGEEGLSFIFHDAGYSDESTLTSYISGWSSMTEEQQHGRWFHVRVNIEDIHPSIFRFSQFYLFNAADGNASQRPHFYLANVKLGWISDTTPPVITFGSATTSLDNAREGLSWTTNEPTSYRIDYGTTPSYGSTINGSSSDDDYQMNHSVELTGLTPGATYYYRITASDHQFLGSDTRNQGTYTGTFTLPAIPTTKPTISNLSVASVSGSSATITWNTDRSCTSVIGYQKAGGSRMTRTLTDYTTSQSLTLDLLEPLSTYTATVTSTDAFGNVSVSRSVTIQTTSNGTPDVVVTINPTQTQSISPYIYGLNSSASMTNAPSGVTFDRKGGNRWTAYNWENNASNAGSDYLYQSDSYVGGGTTPAEAVRSFIASDRSRNQASLVTVQLQGYVAADTNGPTDPNGADLATRFKQVVNKKGSAFTLSPNVADANVYMDEYVWALNQKIPGIFSSTTTLPTFVSLDNEPDLWSETHSEIQTTTPPTSNSYIAKTISLTQALKDQFPDMVTFGPVNYGFLGMYNWQEESGFTSDYWFADKYLSSLKTASDSYGRRLVDVYDFHWYPEARSSDGSRVTGLTGTNLTADQVQAIVQAPRSYWDSTYTENSWIARTLDAPINILGRLNSKINSNFPGTKIALTEYETGGDNHIAGAIAQADTLGIFGSQGVFAANWWRESETYPYIMGAFSVYRGFNGSNANFGDVSLRTTSSQIQDVAVYASTDSQRAGRVVFVAINRSTSSKTVALNGQTLSGTARVYRITAESGAAQISAGSPVAPVYVGEVPVSGSSWTVTLPPLSVSTIEVTP